MENVRVRIPSKLKMSAIGDEQIYPTEKAVIRTFCHETYLIKGVEYADRVIDERALSYTHRYIRAERVDKCHNSIVHMWRWYDS